MVLTGHFPIPATIDPMLGGGGGDIGEGGPGLAIGLASAMAAEPTNNVISTVILIFLLGFICKLVTIVVFQRTVYVWSVGGVVRSVSMASADWTA